MASKASPGGGTRPDDMTPAELEPPREFDPALDEHVDTAVEMFRLLADPTRVRLLRALEPDHEDDMLEMSVNELAKEVGKRPGAVSQHLAKLRMARLVTTRRVGTQIRYRVANEHVTQMVVDALRHSEHLGVGTPPHHRHG